MSAPETNVEKQTRRHKGPLVGIAVAIAVVIAALVVISMISGNDEVPEEAAAVDRAVAVT